MTTQGNQMELWVRNSMGNVPTFNLHQEKVTYQSIIKEMLEPHGEVSTSLLPHIEDPSVPENSSMQVGTLTKLLKSYV